MNATQWRRQLWNIGTRPPRLPTIFSRSLRSRTKFITVVPLLSGSLFSIALKTCQIGNERRSVILTKQYSRFRPELRPEPCWGACCATLNTLVGREGYTPHIFHPFLFVPLAPDPGDTYRSLLTYTQLGTGRTKKDRK